ncbi:MAG: iron-containing alcohol dehydrogenase [Actinobacteria bacterium]|nr:iron-containing alcohol dehydrogenase [Actinomycetota bacterium]
MTRSLVFTGFMGAGKTTCARETAGLAGVAFHDADAVLVERLGEPISAYWNRVGESAFRVEEEQTVLGLLAGPPAVIALGGGALRSAVVRSALTDHAVVFLEVDLETAWSRCVASDRPLAQDRGAFEALFAQRLPVYRATCDAALPLGGLPVVRRALPSLLALARGEAPGLRMLWAASASGDYPVWVGPDAALVAPWPLAEGSRRFCVTDDNVADLHAGRVPQLSGMIEIPAGEEHKTLATAELVWRALVAQGATRADHLVAAGGGVVGDLAGFCAATFQRGIPVVQVPTTLVAQVDSAYGGKTGVDLPEAKNYVGAYHQPSAVLVDPAVLATLPPEEFAAGYAEVLKTALIAGGPLWDSVGSGAPVDADVILECARTKLHVVSQDERDGGLRQVLNLGHTIGHALETVTGYARLRHGEAVGLGLLAALRLSEAPALREQVGGLLEAAGLPVRITDVDVDAVIEATGRDKKRIGANVPFVLCSTPGDPRHGAQVEASAVRSAVAELVA